MRTSFVFSEVVTGLRRNVTMTIAMVITTAISLSLLGSALLIVGMVNNMRDTYRDTLEVSVFLTSDISANDKDCTQDPCAGLYDALEKTSGVKTVSYENEEMGFERAKKMFQSQPAILSSVRLGSIPATLRVSLTDSARSTEIVKAFSGRAGVKNVVDQNTYVARLLEILNGARDSALLFALIQALAAVLLISNTIQVSAFTRRTEVGIMRLVGATRWYTQLPFLIEAVVAGIIGAVGAMVLLIVGKKYLLDHVLRVLFENNVFQPISMLDILVISPVLFGVSIVISALTGYLTLRMYVRL